MLRFAIPGVAVALCALLMAWQLPAGALTVTGPVTGNATWFTALGAPYGGCGLPQANLDSQNFVALNVFNTPGDYNNYPRPIPASMADKIGLWNNGLNCGRYVQVTIGDNCTGINDGAPNQPFCRNGSWVGDGYNGATLTMIVADSCGDANAWCRDDPYHLDLAQASLNTFVKNGAPVGDMYPSHWNNRHITWQFVQAPDYSGDIQIGFLQGAQVWWPAIAVSHLANGIHGVEYLQGSVWTQAQMDSDMGQAYIVGGTTNGANAFQIRVRDANDQLINGGRVYSFSLPSSCGSSCGPAYTQVSYTTSGGSSPGPSTSASPSRSPSTSPSPSVSPSRSASPSASPSSAGLACRATFTVASQWQGGYQATVTVTNTGTVTTTGWEVNLTYPGVVPVSQVWNGTVTTSGSVATVRNAPYNGVLAPGQSTSFGFLGSGSPVTPVLSCTAF
jgi:hypothetical protein